MNKTYTLYDTHYKKQKKDGAHWYEIHFIPLRSIPAPDPETALQIAKKNGVPLPVIGEEKCT